MHRTLMLGWLFLLQSWVHSLHLLSFIGNFQSMILSSLELQYLFVNIQGAVSLAMEADINFNPCVPLIVGYAVGFICSLYPASLNRNVNKNGVVFSFATINRFLLPSVLACIVSAIIQACAVSANGLHILNKLP